MQGLQTLTNGEGVRSINESERKKRGFGTVKPGVFAGERRKGGLIGAPLSTKLWAGFTQKRLFS